MTKRLTQDEPETISKRVKTDEDADAEDPTEEVSNPSWKDRVRESDRRLMDSLNNKYESARFDRESESIKRQYLVTYMKKVVEKLPASRDIMAACHDVEGGDEFLKMYSVAKTCVHSELQLKKLIAFNSVFDMISHVAGKALHDHYVSPYLRSFVSPDRLDAAYESFRDALSSDDANTSTELHCVAYLVQNEMDKSEPLKIPNPVYNRFTQQIKAVSQYVTSVLSSLASKPILPAENRKTEEEEEEEEE